MNLKTLFAAFVLVSSLTAMVDAHAKWTIVGDSVEATYYSDSTTIRKSGKEIKMWHFIDYKTAQEIAGTNNLSIKIQQEYDCKEEQTRHLAIISFTGHMGAGTVVHSDSERGKWMPVAPGSIGESLLNIACKKK